MGSIQNVSWTEDPAAEPIAIVGIGCRLPGGASSPEKLWELLIQKKSARTETPPDRFNIDAFYHPDGDKNGTLNVRGGHFLDEDISAFDAPFFSISPAEALSMDPMQRILLEVVYEATESAGVPIEKLAGSRTGCFVGCFFSDYDQISKRDPEVLPKYHSIGIGQSILSNRISYCLDLKGPSFTLDTACSSSLVALHLACQSLRDGESSAAIVGATNAMLNPDTVIGMTNLHFLSPDSISYTFDERANGYARGEGMAALYLKRMKDAVRDGDTVRAVIRGTAVNSNGKGQGITVPSREAQVNLIRSAYQQAGCDPALTGYCEAHGTGTQAGDPLEAGAIGDAFGTYRPPGEDGKLLVGSVKTNIGHLEGASGLAGIIKAVMSLEKGIIAPNLWFEKGNPKIDFDGWKIKVPTEVTPWPTAGLRRASVNSFGYGGTNGHVVIDDAYHYMHSRGLIGKHHTTIPSAHPNGAPNGAQGVNGTNGVKQNGSDHHIDALSTPHYRLFQISARDTSSIVSIAKLYADYLETQEVIDESKFLDDLAFTLSDRRSKFEFATTVAGSSTAELVESLRLVTDADMAYSKTPILTFVFTGQGAQWFAMGRELMQYPVFARSLRECDDAVQSFGSSWSLSEEFLKDKASSRVADAQISQPLCSALQIALVDLLSSWGVHPKLVVGHSSGEIGAAYATGALSLHAAMRAAYFRGLLSSKVKELGYKGAMMAVGLSEKEALAEIDSMDTKSGKISVACINSPRNVTLSGDLGAINEAQKSFTSRGIFARKLQVDTAYHSHHMLALSEEYRQSLDKLEVLPWERRRDVAMFSSVTGRLVGPEDDLGADYWVSNMVSCVRFSDALAGLCTKDLGKPNILVEVGPHAALSGPVKHILSGINESENKPDASKDIHYASVLVRGQDAGLSALTAVGVLSNKGYPVDLYVANSLRPSKSTPSVLTDLPSYSWNHSKKYWAESRFSRDYRFRQFPRTDLLGAPLMDWNPLQPRWRNFIRVSEQPWVKSHVVQGTIVYPAAGYCCMALEAASQLNAVSAKAKGLDGDGQRISEYIIRDLDISRALVVPETDDGIEVIFSLQSDPVSSDTSAERGSEFSIFSYTNEDGWAEHCRGRIVVKYDQDSLSASRLHDDGTFGDIKESCTMEIKPEQLYTGLDAIGLSYGTEFQGITDFAAGDNKAFGAIQVTDTASSMPAGFQFAHLIHPSTLDTFLQMSIAALSQGKIENLTQPYVPTHIADLCISGRTSLSIGKTLQVAADAKRHSFREIHANLVAKTDDENLVVQIHGAKLSAIASSAGGDGATDVLSHTSVAIWEPDVDQLEAENLNQILRDAIPPIRTRPKDFELLAYYYFDRVLKEIKDSEVEAMHPHHQKFFRYMQRQRDLVLSGQHELQTEDWKRLGDPQVHDRLMTLVSELTEESNLEGRMFTRMGEALVSVLRKEVEPLDLMMKDDLLNRYYSVTVAMDGTYPQVARYINLLSHKYPDLDYLEIGAGTGGCTGPVLDALSGTEGRKYPRMKSYLYTDVSSGFFEQAGAKFKGWGDMLQYRKLDIEQDPESQPGFKDQLYDVIIAANVLHATYEIDRTVAHTRKLLRPGGKLILLDMTHSVGSLSLIFGNLPGWWNCLEPWREYGPLLDENQWRDVLQKNNFTDFQANSPDSLDPLEEQTRVMIATAIEPEAQSDKSPIAQAFIIVRDSSYEENGLVKATRSRLEESGINSQCGTLSEASQLDVSDKAVLSFAELNDALLSDISVDDFTSLQKVINESLGMVWVTRGGVATKGTRPELALFHGLARALRAESEGKRCTTFDLDEENHLADDAAANLIVKLFRKTFGADKAHPAEIVDRELSEEGGVIRIKRVVENPRLNQLIAAQAHSVPVKPELQDIWQSPRPLQLKIQGNGALVFDDNSVETDKLPDDHVLVEVRAVGLGSYDVQTSTGESGSGTIGGECSGVIASVGRAVSHLVKGDRVMAWAPGSVSTVVSSPAQFVVKIPDHISFPEAAALPLAYLTAYYSLVHVSRIAKDDTVLIHSASGDVGRAALQIAKAHGARTFATVTSQEDKYQIASELGVPESQVYLSHDLSFVHNLRQETASRGVDLVINSLTGEAREASHKIVAPFGRFIDVTNDAHALSSASLPRNTIATTVDATELYKVNPKIAAKLFPEAMQLCIEHFTKEIIPITVRPFSGVSEALREIKDGANEKKQIVELRPKDLVMVMPKSLQRVDLSGDSSYLLSGGFGGIGRSVSRWMVRNGARNLIYVSRSGASSREAQALVEELTAQGVHIETIQCDVTDEKKLSGMISQVLEKVPPIKGVIQAAMNLQDQVFANMSYDAYMACMRPKVQGSWSLHQATLNQPLEFFIMLASCTSFWGNAGQSNYAAGCTYQCSLAAHRRSLGLPATSIDVGKVSNIGFIAENQGTQSELNLVRLGLIDQNEAEVLSLVELGMHPTSHDSREPGHGGNIPRGHLLTGQSSSCDPDKGDELPFWSRDPVYAHMNFVRPHLRKANKDGDDAGAASQAVLPLPTLLGSAASVQEAEQHVLEALQRKLARALMMPAQDIDVRKAMAAYGVDSLIAVDLRNWFSREADVDVAVFDIVQAASLSGLASKVASKSPLLKVSG